MLRLLVAATWSGSVEVRTPNFAIIKKPVRKLGREAVGIVDCKVIDGFGGFKQGVGRGSCNTVVICSIVAGRYGEI